MWKYVTDRLVLVRKLFVTGRALKVSHRSVRQPSGNKFFFFTRQRMLLLLAG
jgi:hypothetical protein